MTKCSDIPTANHTNGKVFSIWYGGNARAVKIAKDIAQNLAQKAVDAHNPTCKGGECGTYVGCECHPETFYEHKMVCVANGKFNIVMTTRKTWKTWAKTSAGTYAVGITGTLECTCSPPTPLGEPFDFLGLVNILAGGAKGGKKGLPQSVIDLINWMKKNL